MTIYDIKRATEETAPHYFDRKSMRFFGQTLKSFSVAKQADGRYRISAPRYAGKVYAGDSVRFFNPANNRLEFS